MQRFIIILLLFLLLTSCAIGQPFGPTLTPTSTITNAPTVTSTLISTLTASSSNTPTHPSTTTPTDTPQPPTKTVPLNPQATLTSQAYSAYKTEVADFSITCTDFFIEATQLSPGGDWLAVPCEHSKQEDLEIVNKEGQRWVLQFKDYLAEEALFPDGEIPMGGLYPIHWTQDDRYLYFYSHINYSGGGGCFYGYRVQGLFRINLDSGAVTTLLPATSLGEGYDVSFSPDGRWMVYIQKRPVIVDLKTGEETTIDIGGDHAGNFFWSPDNSALVFTTCRDSEDGSVVQSSINVFSLASNNLSRLLVVQKNFLKIERWVENNLLLIASREQGWVTSYYYYDWSLGQFVTPTPTTQP